MNPRRTILIVRRAALTAFGTGSKLSPRKTASDAFWPTSLAEPGAIVMHPGPINRGVEIAPDVADSLSSVILDQVANGVAVRMGILYLMSGANA